MKKTCLVFYLAAGVLAMCLFLSDVQGAPEDGLIIESMKVTGNAAITETKILEKIRSRVGEKFDTPAVQEDAKRIAAITGVETAYYNTNAADNKVQITFVVVERNLVREIIFNGNVKVKSKALEKKLEIKRGDFLDPVLVEEGRKKVEDDYLKKGYVFSKVSVDKNQFAVGKLVFTIEEGPRPKVRSIKFRGNKVLSSSRLQKVLKFKKTKFLVLPNYLVNEHVDKDVEGLKEVYYQRGFLNVKITAEKTFTEKKDKVNIVYQIEEGPAYKVREIVFAGNQQYDNKLLLGKFQLNKGDIYNKTKADESIKEITKLYRESGYIDSEVKLEVKFVSSDTVDAVINIIEGERFRIGKINITGNEDTQDKVVRRILDEYEFQPGSWWNADIAHGDGSGYLEKIVKSRACTQEVTITPSGEKPGQKDAQVNIIEGQTGSVMVGAGVGSDSGIVGQFTFEQRNFDIKDKPENMGEFITGKAYKGAGQILRVSLMPGTEVSEYSVSFTEPYLNNKPIALDLVGSSYERERESYDEQRMRGFLGFTKRYKEHWSRSLGFRVENVNVDSLEFDAPKEVRDDKGSNMLAGVKFGVGRDMTDDIFTPSKGYDFDISYEQVGMDYTFGILSGVYRRYKTLSVDLAERKTILTTKLLGATTLGDAPVFEKFYAGGMGTYGIRGFEYRGISTRGLQTNVANPEKKDPIGSQWIFLANTEVSIPLVGNNLNGLLFVDSGIIDSGGYRASAGIGVQINIPQWFGPVPMKFALAAPFMKDDEDETQVFSFSVGKLF